MTKPITKLIHEYLRHDKKFPHVWCPGCGNGIVLGGLIRAIDAVGLSKDQVVLVSGIGCSGRMSVYVDFNTLHTTHGRALTFATGIKLVKPELTVVVVMGDGDALSIGGNHLIHAARRNVDINAIIVNNQIYGMTGGQFSSTTPYGAYATTSPYGNIEHAFPISELAVVAGASFVARATVYHAQLLEGMIEAAIKKRGFSLVEVISTCPVQYGRRNKLADPVAMMTYLKENSVKKEKADTMDPKDIKDKFVIGILADVEKPVYMEDYLKVKEKSKS
ncbi:MAG: 2-oxoacid:ferredoxin oxidoreductase subunit beta [Desulfatiglandales bacterium]